MPADFTPEALLIPRVNPLMRDNVVAPQNIAGAAATPITIYDETLEQPCSKIVLQNQAVGVLKVAFNTDAGAGTYHRDLAACTTAEDGLGGNCEIDVLSKGIRKISVYSDAAVSVSVEKYQRSTIVDAP